MTVDATQMQTDDPFKLQLIFAGYPPKDRNSSNNFSSLVESLDNIDGIDVEVKLIWFSANMVKDISDRFFYA